MRKLAAGLGFACIVLLLLAFDEQQATRAVDAVRAGVGPVVTRAGALIRGEPVVDAHVELKVPLHVPKHFQAAPSALPARTHFFR